MSQVSYLVEFTINDGQLDAFKDKVKSLSASVKESEPGTVGYRWCMGEDNAHCLVHESFESSDAFLFHLQNTGPSLPALLALAPITRCEVFGSVSDEAREALATLGAKHFPDYAGFTR